MHETCAVILKGYPRLSETFIAQELLSLQQNGLAFEIYSLRHPTDKKRHAVNDEITARVTYLPEYLHWSPWLIVRSWWQARKLPGYKAARKAWLADLKRDFSRNRIRRMGQALVLATILPEQTTWIYVHFLHTPASVARYTALLKHLPWSCSAHAKDIYTQPEWEIREKLKDLSWLATCTRHNVEYLGGIAPTAADRINLIYHGLDFSRFPPSNNTGSWRDGSDRDDPVRILSVGRAVEKKGYDVLLNALALLPDDLCWRFDHLGGGTLLENLKTQALDLGIAKKITWHGAAKQSEVLEAYRSSDLFVLASHIGKDGDRDGLPNVLMEAQSQELACVSTRVSAIPELILDNKTGLLVDPLDERALAEALERLARDAKTRRKLAKAGALRVHEVFSHDHTIKGLLACFKRNDEKQEVS